MRVLCLHLLVALLGFVQSAGAEVPAQISVYRDEVFAECRSAGGTPSALDGFILERDLNGDGAYDYVVNLHALNCENAYSYFCGSAGCPVRVWTSGRQGHSVAWSGYAQEISWDGPIMIAYLHGQFCNPPRSGFDGCEVRISFDGASTAARSAAPEPATAARPAAPASDRWSLRSPGNAPPVAVIGGVGSLRSLAAFCLEGQPWLALLFDPQPAADAIRVDFTFSSGSQWGPAQRGSATGGAYMIGLSGHTLARQLAGSDRHVTLAMDGIALGDVSLAGSSKALRAALGACHRF